MACEQNWSCPEPGTPTPLPKPEPQTTTAQAAAAEQTDVLVSIVPQALARMNQPAQALPLGTLFPELNKPLLTTSSPVTARPTQKQIDSFAAWELRLYLDTHPSDTIALSIFRQMANSAGNPNYASTFAMTTACGRWTWLDDPWPWEYGASSGFAAEV